MTPCDRCQANRELRQDAEMYRDSARVALAASEARVSALTAALERHISYLDDAPEVWGNPAVDTALARLRNVLAPADRQPAEGEG